jgi:hypothetical protein
MNQYSMRVIIINQEVECDLRQRKTFILHTIGVCNSKWKASEQNVKFIDENDCVVNEKSIYFTMYSENELSTPGRSLKLFSQLLIKENEKFKDDSKFFRDHLSHGKLFKTFPVLDLTENKKDNATIVDPNDIDDGEFLKALIDYVLKPKTPYTPQLNIERNAVNQMKLLVLNSGILIIN